MRKIFVFRFRDPGRPPLLSAVVLVVCGCAATGGQPVRDTVTAAVHASDYTSVTPERGWVQPGAAHVQVPNLKSR
jgi:hypothetical protein